MINIFKKKKSEPRLNGADTNSNLSKLIDLTARLTEMEQERSRILEEMTLKDCAFNALVLLTSDWVWMTDETGTYSYASSKAETVYGYNKADVIGKMPHDFVRGTEKEDAVKLEKYLIESHGVLDNFTTISTDAYGNPVRVMLSCVPIIDSNGIYRGHLGIEKCTPYVSEIPRQELMVKFENGDISITELNELKMLLTAEMKLVKDTKFIYLWLLDRIEKLIEEVECR